MQFQRQAKMALTDKRLDHRQQRSLYSEFVRSKIGEATMDCIFCKIAEGTIKSDILYQNDHVIAFRDLHPQAPTHILIIPRQHYSTVNDFTAQDVTTMGEMILAAKNIAAKLGLAGNGYRLNINTNRDGGQTVFHVHMHFLAGRAFGWPPG